MSWNVQYILEKNIIESIIESIWANFLSVHDNEIYGNAKAAIEKCFRGEDFSQELR
jgi:hypothetical protein